MVKREVFESVEIPVGDSNGIWVLRQCTYLVNRALNFVAATPGVTIQKYSLYQEGTHIYSKLEVEVPEEAACSDG